MGVWGSELYSGDFATDMRGTVRSAARLPFEGDRLVELLISVEPSAANRTEHEEHTTFWLVVADQFAKLGIVSDRARQQALQIIDDGSDIAMLTKLGMDANGLRKRQKVLDDLRVSLVAAQRNAKRRSAIKKPQPLVIDIGDVFVYPTSLGRCRETCPEWMHVVPAWEQDGWNAMVVASAERAFDFLAWYRPLILASPVKEKPQLSQLRSFSRWILRPPGTCRAVDLKRLCVEKIGTVRVDSEKLKRSFPTLPAGTRAALDNRSIERELTVGSHVGQSYISEKALKKSPDGLSKLPELIRKATENYEKMRALRERPKGLGGRQDPSIAILDEILS
jgi:hypothetical protein